MKSVLYGLAALPFLAGVALAGQPMQLSDNQMDKVTAGFDLTVVEVSNSSWTAIDFRETPLPACSACYLIINKGAFQVESAMQPTPGP